MKGGYVYAISFHRDGISPSGYPPNRAHHSDGTAAAFGLPIEGVALILGIDRILDMGRTATNVIGNAIATVVVARSEKALPEATLQLTYAKSYED
jgi:Na+/H+-dicarboxylate symporter